LSHFKRVIPLDSQRDLDINIYDFPGNDRYRPIISTYYPHVAAVILVYDVTDADSFGVLQNYIGDATLKNPNIAFFVAGNKVRHVNTMKFHQIVSNSSHVKLTKNSIFRNTTI